MSNIAATFAFYLLDEGSAKADGDGVIIRIGSREHAQLLFAISKVSDMTGDLENAYDAGLGRGGAEEEVQRKCLSTAAPLLAHSSPVLEPWPLPSQRSRQPRSLIPFSRSPPIPGRHEPSSSGLDADAPDHERCEAAGLCSICSKRPDERPSPARLSRG
jgi:hypothetical protein